MARKLVSIIFLLLLFMNQAGHYLVFLYQQNQLEKEMEARLLAGIPASSLEIIEDDGQLIWEEAGREFHYRGELYDVAWAEEQNGRTLYHCINDVKEKQLLKNYTKALQTGHHNASGKGKHAVKFQFTTYTSTLYTPLLSIDEDGQRHYCHFKATLITGAKDVTAPPPRA